MDKIQKIVDEDNWSIAEGIHNQLPLIIRFRTKFTSSLNTEQFSQLIKIYWEFEEDPSGMPSESESETMEIFENRLVDALESDYSGVLTSVVTTNGYRHWVLYVKSVDLFSKRLHSMPQENHPYPIQIQTQQDAKWEYYFNNIKPKE